MREMIVVNRPGGTDRTPKPPKRIEWRGIWWDYDAEYEYWLSDIYRKERVLGLGVNLESNDSGEYFWHAELSDVTTPWEPREIIGVECTNIPVWELSYSGDSKDGDLPDQWMDALNLLSQYVDQVGFLRIGNCG